MKRSILTEVLALSLCTLALPASAQQPGETSTSVTKTAPGKGTMTQTRTVVGTVVDIDPASRHVTVKGPGGATFPLTLGADVRNVNEVKVGDRVTVRYVAAL